MSTKPIAQRPVVNRSMSEEFDRGLVKFSEHHFEFQRTLTSVSADLSKLYQQRGSDSSIAAGVGGKHPLDALEKMADKFGHGLLSVLGADYGEGPKPPRPTLTNGNASAVRDYCAAISDDDLIGIEMLLGQADRDSDLLASDDPHSPAADAFYAAQDLMVDVRELRRIAMLVPSEQPVSKKADATKKTSLPEGDGYHFCKFLKKRLRGSPPVRGQIRELAKEYIEDHPKCSSTFESLERKAREFPHVWKADGKADT